MHVEETIEANAHTHYQSNDATQAKEATDAPEESVEDSIENSANLPTLCPTLIDDMGQLFSIYSLEKAMTVAKEKWPQFRFVLCSEHDMYEKEPYKTFNGFSFFLIAATLGCATLTYQPNKSVGLIISEHEPD